MDNMTQETSAPETSVDTPTLSVGERVTGTIEKIVGALVFVNLGEAGTARMDHHSLYLEGDAEPQVGDSIEAEVKSLKSGIELSREYVEIERALVSVVANMESQSPVQGTITSIHKNKRSYEVRLNEKLTALCPVNEFDPRHERASRRFVNQSFEFLVTEINDNNGRKRVMLSRKALLDEEQRRIGQLMVERFNVGDVVTGRVSNIAKFGVFVDFGDKIEGLIPMGELSHQHIKDAASVVSPKQEVEVKVISVDGERNRLSLSIRQLSPDPWDIFVEANPAGSTVKGTVKRVVEFGAFIELAEHVEGLLHIGAMKTTRVNDPNEVVSEGQEIDVVIEEVVRGERNRIRLMTPEVAETRKPLDFEVKEGIIITVTVAEANAKGVAVNIGGSFSGFIPASETDTERGTNLTDKFPAGSEIEAKILSVDSKRGRVRLSIKAIKTHAEEEAAKAFRREMDAENKGFDAGLSAIPGLDLSMFN